MDEQRAVMSTFQRFLCSKFPTLNYLFNVVGLNSTNAFLTTNKKTLKNPHKNLSGVMDEAVASAIIGACGVITIHDLDCMALAINLLANRGVKYDATLVNTLEQDAAMMRRFSELWTKILYFISIKARTDGVELTKLPNTMQPKTTTFRNCFTTIKKELYQKTSADGITPLRYVIHASNTPVDY